MSKKITISELKTFIDAVEFAADDDNWIPSKRQWMRIREMINNLEDEPAPPVRGQQPMPMLLPGPPFPTNPNLAEPGIMATPSAFSSTPMPHPPGSPFAIPTQGGGGLSTQAASDGPYQTPFA